MMISELSRCSRICGAHLYHEYIQSRQSRLRNRAAWLRIAEEHVASTLSCRCAADAKGLVGATFMVKKGWTKFFKLGPGKKWKRKGIEEMLCSRSGGNVWVWPCCCMKGELSKNWSLINCGCCINRLICCNCRKYYL